MRSLRWHSLLFHPVLFGAAILACAGESSHSPDDALEQYYEGGTHAAARGDIIGHRALIEQDSQAIFVTQIEQEDSTTEWYAFLSRTKRGWKVDTVRTLEFPESYYERIDSIQEGLLQDSLLPPRDANLSLTVANDSTIKAYLIEHKPLLDSIVDLFMRRAVLSTVDVALPATPEIRDGAVLSTNRNVRVQDLLERAHVTKVFRDARYPHCTFVRINGMARTEVGYVHADEGCVPPPMNPENFIYVERIADAWYVYKVT